MRYVARLVLFMTGLALAELVLSPVASVQAQSTIDKPLANKADEKRALALHKLLRCLVCQNQSISDSNAELARDLRILVRQRIGGGDSDDETIAYIVDRYGDWVLLDPPIKSSTWVLWFGPVAIFLLALIGVFLFMRRSRIQPAAAPASLNLEEEARLKELMKNQDGSDI
jgi:cytochrome c-type biogenesis protein CcmH